MARICWGLAAALVLALGCGGSEEAAERLGDEEMNAEGMALPPVLATNAFYYYADVEAAWDFYARVLGFETVADYGFAKILRVAPTSYLTLVDEARGMHSVAEPKSVTLAVVTEEVEEWWAYLSRGEVEIRSPLGEVGTGRPHDGFVVVDPEGYLLEFERFNPHPENTDLMPVLERSQGLYTPPETQTAPGVVTERPADLGVKATVLWLYFRDLEAIQHFYTEALGGRVIVDQGWAKVFTASPTGFLGFVDGERGLHSATTEKAVTISFFTPELEPWFSHLQSVPGFTLRTPEISPEGDFVRTFVGYDPEGYFLEWDTFLDVESNRKLLERMKSPDS